MLESCKPHIISHGNHCISRKNIARTALQVLYQLHHAGYAAYLVGGSVRDLLLGMKPKDFDIVTNASPEKVRALFGNSRTIGRRFKLVHVFFGREIIEVATFRGSHPEDAHPDAYVSATGFLIRDNIYGTLEEDVWRRDLSVNALYYNIADCSVLDYVGGVSDLEKRTIRILGDTPTRYREDPVRMLRAIRFSAKLHFNLDPAAKNAMLSMKTLLRNISPSRLFEEILKLMYCGEARYAFQLLQQYGLFEILFPETHAILCHDINKTYYLNLILQSCQNTDKRIQQHSPVNPAFSFAVLLWPVLQVAIRETDGKKRVNIENITNKILRAQLLSIPKRHVLVLQEIWSMQKILEKKVSSSLLIKHPRFRAAYDFLLLRWEAGEIAIEHSIIKWRKTLSKI